MKKVLVFVDVVIYIEILIFVLLAGNLFGVSLSTLLLRDSQLTSEENNIPLVFQKILNELTKRGVKEEGILRVGGHKQKVSAQKKENLNLIN